MHTTPTHRTSATRRSAVVILALAIGTLAVPLLPADPASAAPTSTAITAKVSTDSNGESHPGPVSGDVVPDTTGRYVFFTSSQDLGVNDNDFFDDVFRKDRLTGETTELSVVGEDDPIQGPSRLCGVSPDGNYVAFTSKGTNLPGAGLAEVYLRDVAEQTTTLVSVNSAEEKAGFEGTDFLERCPVSGDGKTILFVSTAPNLVSGDTNNVSDVFVRRLGPGTTERVSVVSGGAQSPKGGRTPAISADGKVAAFVSQSKLTATDETNSADVFVRVLATSTVTLGSEPAAEAQQDKPSDMPSLSANGSYLAFQSQATNLVPGVVDDNGDTDVFRKYRPTGAVQLVSQSSAGVLANAGSKGSSISADGRYVAFSSLASNLYPVDVNGVWDAFRRDMSLDRTDLASRVSGGIAVGDATTFAPPRVSPNGLVVGFQTSATNLVEPHDDEDDSDAFVRDFALDITPFPSIKAFVAQQVLDFSGAPATPAMLDLYSRIIQNGVYSPDRFIVFAAHSEPWAAKRGPLVRLYWAFFLRIPDLGGMDYWTKKLTNGMTLAKVAAEFAKSSEFQTKYGALSNKAFVTLIYQNIFDRDPDAGGLAYWTGKLDKKEKTRGDVMVNFSESSEGKRFLAPQVDTVLIWLGMQRTMPPKVFFDAWVDAQKWQGIAPEAFATFSRQQAAYATRVA